MTLNSVSSNVVKIAQSFAFGRKRANQGGLPGFTIGFFQQSLDSCRAFVNYNFVQFILKTVAYGGSEVTCRKPDTFLLAATFAASLILL